LLASLFKYINFEGHYCILLVVDLEKGIYREWVPMGAFVKGLVVFFSFFLYPHRVLDALSNYDSKNLELKETKATAARQNLNQCSPLYLIFSC